MPRIALEAISADPTQEKSPKGGRAWGGQQSRNSEPNF